ncbi:MAG: hypothetical protein AUI13_16265 [Gemmatimonadetes bacterium 13_2_20CM_2_69_23]|nr:MAG: hypothetical protein AUI13_16265 [Gemmatimonadetes bacterium 13_2_20CM_2_69_23]
MLVSVMAPLVTVQLTPPLAGLPLLVRPIAVKSAVWFCRSVRILGEMTSRQTALASGPVSAIGFSQADSVASASAAVEKTTHRSLSIASRRESLCMNVIVLRPRYS